MQGISKWRKQRQEILRRSGRLSMIQVVKKHWMLLLMLLPAVLHVLVFSYLPMSGVVLAFKTYRYRDGIFGSPWVGLENFEFLLASGRLWPITRNTMLYNFTFLVVDNVCEVAFAIMLSEMMGKHYKKLMQTFMFMPYFVSWVVVKAVMYNLFNYEKGVVNNILGLLGMSPLNLYNMPNAWPPLLVFLKLWKSAGYGSVVYLAAVTGLDRSMYEAADIDGANTWQKIFRITVPSLVPTIIIMMLLGIGNIFRGDFGMFYQTVGDNARLLRVADVIDTYVFRALMDTSDIGMAAAGALYQSVLCFVTVIFFNRVVKWYEADYALF